MACKLRRAIGAVKDQTSISLAKVSNAANLEVSILKATTHDEIPMEDRYVDEIVRLVSSNKVYAASCAQCIGKRIGKTHNWVVALKSLMLVLRLFQDGDPYFPREIFHAMKRGAKILNLSSFKDDSTSNSWDYSAFVRTFALYLDERLDCFLTGKLQRRYVYHHSGIHGRKFKSKKASNDPGIKDMKPTLVLDRITHWQKLLDRAIGSRPTGIAKKNALVQISLYAIVQESFDLYRDISDGLAVILDSFFELPYRACVVAFNACVKSSKQFDDLSGFYVSCASLGVGRTSEYPSVQKVSDELMETLQEFLKDHASFCEDNGKPQSPLKRNLLPPIPKDSPRSSLGHNEAYEQSETPKGSLDGVSEYDNNDSNNNNNGSQSSTLVDSMSADFISLHSGQDEKQSPKDDSARENDIGSISSLPVEQPRSPSFDMMTFDDFNQAQQHDSPKNDQEQQNTSSDLGSNNGSKDCWDLVLAEISTKPDQASPNKLSNNGSDLSIIDTLFDQPSSSVSQPEYNPFLENTATTAPFTPKNYKDGFPDLLGLAPTFQAIEPKFSAQSPREETISPTFTGQSSNYGTSLALTYTNLNGLTIAPNFGVHGSSAQNLDNIIESRPCYSPGSYQTVSSPTFQAYNSNDNFNPKNHNMAMTVPTLSPQNQNGNKTTIMPSSFWTLDFDDGTKAETPTFSAKNSNVTTPNTRDDPFEAWFNALTLTNNQCSSTELKQ